MCACLKNMYVYTHTPVPHFLTQKVIMKSKARLMLLPVSK